jgi:hypothetical protein
MKTTDSHTADDFLDLYVAAARQQFDAAEVDRAAESFRQKLPRARGGGRRTMRWLSLVAASVVFAAVTAVSLFLPGQTGSAFAQAQQWFSTFRTLRIETTAQMGQETVSQVTFWLNATGDLRIEAAGATTIVRTDTDTIYVVLPDGQALAQSIPPEAGESIDWLEEIRSFQGQADLLDESRLLDDISAIGYGLTAGSTTFEVWVDPFDGRPLLIEAETPAGATVRHVLNFDVPLPVSAFAVPDGVQPVEAHE